MCQEQLTAVAAYPQPRIRVSANYAATDGSCPEHIEVEIFDTEGADLGRLVAEAVHCLAGVPSRRWPSAAAVKAAEGEVTR